MYSVYKIQCLENSRIYIGQTCDFDRRMIEHKSELRRNKHGNCILQEDYNKYGLNSFEISVLEYCNSKEDSLKREKYWINQFRWCRQ